MNLMHAKVRVGESTRFDVSSNRWGCTNCESRFLKLENPFMGEGMKCPDCKVGDIEERYHLVDLASHDLNGACSCEWFAFSIAPKVRLMQKGERLFRPKRCAHIDYARSFALNVLLKLHILEEHGGKPINPEHET